LDPSKLPPAAQLTVDFEKDVKPIFEKTCFRCHGPERPKSRFRLDNRESALKGGDNGVDIVPGDSAQSPLVYYVARVAEDIEMPPPGKGEPLTPVQVGLLRAWIDQGALMPEKIVSGKDPANHWAFKAPVKPELPKGGKRKAENGNAIDAFVLARLEKEKLKPSSEADKIILLRRYNRCEVASGGVLVRAI